MGVRFIGIGELLSSNCAQDSLITLGLGSCVAVAVSHAPTRCAALAHIALPSAKWDGHRKTERPPAFYADKAIARIFFELGQFPGFHPSTSHVSLVGGASLGQSSSMHVGAKNVGAVLDALRSLRLRPGRSLTGGTRSRNVRLEVASGGVWVKEQELPEREL